MTLIGICGVYHWINKILLPVCPLDAYHESHGLYCIKGNRSYIMSILIFSHCWHKTVQNAVFFPSIGPKIWLPNLQSTICKYWFPCNICYRIKKSNIYSIHKPQLKTNASNGVSILNWLASKQTEPCIHLFLQSTIDYGSVIIKQDSEVWNQ